jgi:subtilase family serine protease
MRSILLASAAAVAALPLLGSAAFADRLPTGARTEIVPRGIIVTPSSSMPATDPRDTTAHTNIKFFFPGGHTIRPDATAVTWETPASLACIYGVVKATSHCNNTVVKTVATGGSKMIAIVDAYDDPNAEADLAVYSKQYGLPAPSSENFEVVYATGKQPKQDPTGGWEAEESLDVDMAHAIAPKAKVVLVEAASPAQVDLLQAEKIALRMVNAAGGGEVSNSWAGPEYSAEAALEPLFTSNKVVVFASAGDSSGVGTPSILPNVVSVGGTTINRANSNGSGNFKSETTWSSTGGGLSAYLATPSYQSKVTSVVGTHRGSPDIAADANPASGAVIYDSIPYEGQTLDFVVIGGTSLASPLVAALVNNAGSFNTSTTKELTEIYANLGNTKAFADITAGQCPNAAGGAASVGYDLCTGVGAPISTIGK